MSNEDSAELMVLPQPQGLTPAEVAEYQERHGRILAAKREIGKAFWQVGQDLKAIRDKKLYLAGDYPTFEAYLGSPEIGISRSTAYTWIEIVAVFEPLVSNMLDISDIDWEKLRRICRVVKAHPEQAQEWLAKARALSRSDLNKELQALEANLVPSPFEEEIKAIKNYIDKVLRALKQEDRNKAVEELQAFLEFGRSLLVNLKSLQEA